MKLTVESVIPPSVTDVTPPRGIVAIVDDDPQVSRALGLWLDLQGLRAVHHISGESLLQSIHQDDGVLTLHLGSIKPLVIPLVGAVLDLNLPGITGIELAKALRRQSPALPLVVITALREEERARYGAPPPGVRCLKKPFDLDALEDALFPLLH
jgi:DNA-binding response OmpR family regulator